MNKLKPYEKNLLPAGTLDNLIQSWNSILHDEGCALLGCSNELRLVDTDGWQSKNVDELIALCRRWKQRFLKNKSDNHSGSLEWLFCILRHNATTYDRILKETADRHSWAPGFGSLLRLKADCLLASHFYERNLYGELTRKCQTEWMWCNRSEV